MTTPSDEDDFLAVHAIANPQMRQAIGGVCVHWAILELSVERVISNLRGDPGVVTYQEDMGHALDTMKKLARESEHLIQEQKNEIVDLAGKIKTLAQERHRVVHGLWGMDTAGQIHSLFPRSKPHEMPGRPMTEAEVVEIKRRVWRTGKALQKFASATQSVALAWPRKPKPRDLKCPKIDESAILNMPLRQLAALLYKSLLSALARLVRR